MSLVPFAQGADLAVPDSGIALGQHATFTRSGLTIDPAATPEELRNIVSGFDMLQDSSCFAVGDVVNFYRDNFPEEWRNWIDSLPKQSAERGNLDQKTVMVYAAVCKAYPLEFRARFRTPDNGRRVLSFGHFSRVRRYGLEVAAQYLEHAATANLSVGEMEAVIEQGTPGQDEHPPVPTTPDSQFGYIYDLGNGHRLLCGDSRDPGHLAALLGDERADMIWTDPPYGVDYVGKTAEALTIQNDAVNSSALADLLGAAWRAAEPVCAESTPFYVAGPPGNHVETFLASFRLQGWRFQQTLVWRKNRMILGHNDYHYQHEFIFYGFTPGRRANRLQFHGSEQEMQAAIARGEGLQRWFGGNNAVSVFDADSPSASREHPTMKPVRLIVPAIQNSCPPGGIVLDPFAGSGSTLIAAEQTGRRAYIVEFDPRYADVIRTRYTDYLARQAAAPRPDAPPVAPDNGPSAFDE